MRTELTHGRAPNERQRGISAISLPADPLMLHPCAHPDCDALALTRHCERHASAEELTRLDELHEASVEMVRREELWRAARARVGSLEAALGIVRRSPTIS